MESKISISRPPFWCDVCSLDLQSQASLQVHQQGRKHRNRSGENMSQAFMPPLNEEDFFRRLQQGEYQNIVVLTGAGVSTAAGIPDYRSPGVGLFQTFRQTYKGRFPGFDAAPESLCSRRFVQAYPDVWHEEILPKLQSTFSHDLRPCQTHQFCAHLYRQGWLRRVYTQNVDGLHLHPSLDLPQDLVVECHGSMARGDVVLYGDNLPQRFFECARKDFDHCTEKPIDLVMIFGTSLQVAPFCGLPNMVPKGCTRVLVNRQLADCLSNDFSAKTCNNVAKIGNHKSVSLRPLWLDRKARKKWSQLMVEDECEAFVERFMKSTQS